VAEEETQEEAEKAESNEAEQGQGAEASEPQNRRARRAAAAQARKARMRERREAEAVGLDTQEMLDDALARSTDKAGKWVRKNSSTLQWVFVAGVVGWAGWGLYNWQAQEARAEASAALAIAVDTERGKVGDPSEQGKPNEQNVIDPTPIFEDRAALRKAALERFQAAEALRAGSGTSAYAQLGAASVLYDEGKFDEAATQFESVANSELAKSDPELRGRALDGLALTQESKGDKEAALKTYGRLDNTDTPGFEELALYQQARLQRDLGQLDAAKENIKKLNEKLGPSEPLAFSASYLEIAAKTLGEELGVEKPPPASNPITPEQLKALQAGVQQKINAASEQIKENQESEAAQDEGEASEPSPEGDAPSGSPEAPSPQ
jgi:predicted negative regulator of RcsB-dependent stress response